MRTIGVGLVLAVMLVPATARAATIVFNSDPFAGSTAPTTPGRQIVGDEPFLTFDIANDTLAFDLAVFGVNGLSFINTLTSALPASGFNFIVVQDTGPNFAAGQAADLIAARITDPGPGFFIYFNTGLGRARLVYSTDLSVNDADLQILARFTNLTSLSQLTTITSADVEAAPVPEPATSVLLGIGLAATGITRSRRSRRSVTRC